MKKKLLALYLVFCLVLGMPAAAIAAETEGVSGAAETVYQQTVEETAPTAAAETSTAWSASEANQDTAVAETSAAQVIAETQSANAESATASETEPESDSEAQPVTVSEPDAESETETGTEPETDPERDLYENKDVYDFVNRFYELTLGRKPEPDGMRDWYTKLVSREITGTEVAKGFILSDEFTGKGLSDEEYVSILYRTFLGREPDSAGLHDWLNRLDNSVPRKSVYNGFANSKEFHEICASYGIDAGSAPIEDILEQSDGVTMFVHRCYEMFLGREPDSAGLRDWVGRLLQGKESPQRIAYGFVFSSEFIGRHVDNGTFVRTMYNGLFDREADAPGYNDWMARMSTGQTRLQIFKGFVFSDEFRKMIKAFGLSFGSDTLSDINDYNSRLRSIQGPAYAVFDEKRGEFLIARNIDQVRSIASQTKLMTALVTLGHVDDLNAPVTMTAAVARRVSWSLTQVGLTIGRSYTVRNLLEGLLVFSGADCAYLLADYVCGGDMARFVEMMNEKAAELGMKYTTFSDPAGLNDDNATTIREYMKLALAARANPVIREIVAMPRYTMEDAQGNIQKYYGSTNNLLNGTLPHDQSLYTVSGMKTGTTNAAGYCQTTSAYNSDGSSLIAVIWHTTSNAQRGYDSKTLLDVAFLNARAGYYSLAR